MKITFYNISKIDNQLIFKITKLGNQIFGIDVKELNTVSIYNYIL